MSKVTLILDLPPIAIGGEIIKEVGAEIEVEASDAPDLVKMGVASYPIAESPAQDQETESEGPPPGGETEEKAPAKTKPRR